MLITVQVVNMSIDAVDPSASFEDLTINEIETCAEFVLELVLDYDNVIGETHDHDHASGKPCIPHILFANLAHTPDLCNEFDTISIFNQIRRTDQVAAGFLITFYPPPKFV